jgi:flagellar biosynthesis protein FliR
MLSISLGQMDLWLSAIFWPFVRLLALFMSAPVLSHHAIPARVKIGLALVVAVVVTPASPASITTAPGIFSAAAPLLLIQQMLLGVMMGFAVKVVFAAIDLAGNIIGLQMGLSFASFIDPVNANQTPLVGSFLNLLATLLFLALDGHLILIASITRSFELAPVSAQFFSGIGWEKLTALGAGLFQFGLQLSLPVLATMLVINLTLGVMSRAAPQLNLFSVGFPLTALTGIVLFAVFLPNMMSAISAALSASLASP